MSFCPLEDIADVSLGFKSLQNDFFYLDRHVIDTFRIEDRFLKPLFRLSELDGARYIQNLEATTWLFHCQERMADLRGTGALRYIETMADHSATEKKQSGRAQTIRQALEAQGGGHWYAPKARVHKHNIWVRKAIDGVFAPLLFNPVALVDQRLQSVSVRDTVDAKWEEIAAALTLSAFAYSVEINGSSSMGAGVLEAPTTKLRSYPVLDIAKLNTKDRDKLVTLARAVWMNEAPLDWSQDKVAPGKLIRELDSWMLATIGSSLSPETLYEDLHEACLARVSLAKDKAKKVKKKRTENIGNVADSIAGGLQPRIKGKRFPEDFIEAKTDIDFQISRDLVTTLTISPLLGVIDFHFLGNDGKHDVVFSYPQALAESIIRAVLWGRSSFQLSSNSTEMSKALNSFLRWARDLSADIDSAIADSALGTGYETQLRTEVLRRLGVHPSAFEMDLPAVIAL